MRLRLCFALVLIGVGSLACSTKTTKKKANSQSTATQTDTNTNTDPDAGGPDAGGTNATADCPVWPAEKLAPAVGPFFFGNDPRPCRVDMGSTHLFYTYDGDGRVIQYRNVAGAETTDFAYDDYGYIVSSTKANSKGATTTTYEYLPDSTVWTTTDGSGASITTTYKLDSQGYPTETVLTPAPADQPARYVYEYENCRLVKRIAYEADGSVNEDFTAEYTYNDEDRMAGRSSTKDSQVFIYQDDDGNCPSGI